MVNDVMFLRNPYSARTTRVVAIIMLCLACSITAQAQKPTIFDTPQSEGRVHYTLQATLMPETRMVLGNGTVRWRNPDTVPVDTIEFHLYLNAFRDRQTTFMRESRGVHRGFSSTDSPGSIRMTQLSTRGDDILNNLIFIRPDDGNPDDYTVAEVSLPEPVLPGDTIELEMAFEAMLPEIVARTGWKEKADGSLFFMVAQWFPKLGVYEIPGQRYVPVDAPHGRWSTHQFHANSEFYADFGTYEITIHTPQDYVIGATGVRTHMEVTDDRRTERYYAEDVHDFAWTASPVFKEFKTTWRHVNMRLLMQPEHASQAKRHFKAAKIALEEFDTHVGLYPYTTLTLVDGIGGSNGMEYPTLITCGTTVGIPSWVRYPELVTVHEFGHQYFYGMLANNEAEEAWLDEGINSYVETRIMDDAYGPGSAFSMLGIHIDDAPLQRLVYRIGEPGRGALFTRSWEYNPSSDYGRITYAKSATVLHALEQYLGREVMDQFLRTYYERWRFRHPTTRDVQAVLEDVTGDNFDWFFTQYVYGTAVVDYALTELDGTSLHVERKRDGTFPQVLHVRFEDGSSEMRAWDGQATHQVFEFDQGITEAWLERNPLDVQWLNNRIQALPHTGLFSLKYSTKTTGWMQHLWHFLGYLF